MDCQRARDWLLQAEDPRPASAPSAALADHLDHCAACRALSTRLLQLEQRWRDLPVPAEAEPARLAFLKRLPKPSTEPAAPQRLRRRQHAVERWLVAALLFLGIGAPTWFLVPTPQAAASPAVIEQLIDWNLHLAQAPSLVQRSEIFAAKQGQLRLAVLRSRLPAEEKEIAELLLANGFWLTGNDDPLTEAERFSQLADKLVKRIEQAVRYKDHAAAGKYARLQTIVARRGVSARLTQLEESDALNLENERRLEKIMLRDAKRRKQLADLLEREPNLKRKEIRRELEASSRIVPQAEKLAFTIETQPPTVVVGQPLTCRIHLANQGQAPLGKLQLMAVLPESVELVSVKPPPARPEGSFLIFRPIPVLAPGQETTFEFQLQPLQSGERRLRVELRSKQFGYRPLVREHKMTVGDR